MYSNVEITNEEEDDLINKIAHKIHSYEFDFAAILMIESIKPMSYVGSQMGRFFISPLLPSLGENIERKGEKMFQVFEKRENIDKILKAIKKLKHEEEERKKAEKAKNPEKSSKKGWRRFLSF